MDLADKIINQGSSQSNAPEGYYLDDLGYFVEENLKDDKARMAEYALFRIRKIHKNIYTHNGLLFCGHEPLMGSKDELLKLADSPHISLNAAQAAWVYNRLKEVAQPLDERFIQIAPGVVWDMEKAEIVERENIITIEEEHGPRERF